MSSLKTVVIGGGTGFIGSALGRKLYNRGLTAVNVSRMPGPSNLSWEDLVESGLPKETEAVVNLAGQNLMDPFRRWTPGFQQNVWNSRVNTTFALANAIIKAERKPKVFVSISGVGIYPPSTTAEYTEDSPVKEFDFLSKLAIAWEQAAEIPPEHNVRQVIIRPGVVLGREGGMIQQLYLPFFMGVGGQFASGNQFMPWIYVGDLADLIHFAITNDSVKGILNGVAPQVITNKDFTKAFAKAMWRPAFVPVPKFAIEIAFGTDRAKMMVEGQKVIPKRVLEYGFKYEHPDIDSACRKCARLLFDPCE